MLHLKYRHWIVNAQCWIIEVEYWNVKMSNNSKQNVVNKSLNFCRHITPYNSPFTCICLLSSPGCSSFPLMKRNIVPILSELPILVKSNRFCFIDLYMVLSVILYTGRQTCIIIYQWIYITFSIEQATEYNSYKFARWQTHCDTLGILWNEER